MSVDPDEVLRALDALESALETFRAAYTEWLAGEGAGDGVALVRALAEAQERLDAARTMLANAADEQSHP